METPPSGAVTARPAEVRELPIVAGHLALDFANTVDDPLGPQRFDHVANYPALVAWAQRVAILQAPAAAALQRGAARQPHVASAAVARAATLRTALNETFGALVEDRPPSSGWEQLRPFVVEALGTAHLVPASPHPVPGWRFEALESPLWPVAEAAYRLLTGPELARLKRCAGCPWLFLDHSRNGSRRWCAMEDCGTHEKIRRYVSRRAERRSQRTDPEVAPSGD